MSGYTSPFNGGYLSKCTVFQLRLEECIKREVFDQVMCIDEQEDFEECSTNLRSSMLRKFLAKETEKTKILSLPRYNPVTDAFEDGPLPKSLDSILKNDVQMNKLFNN